MNATQEWKIAGFIATSSGIFSLISGRAGLTYYGYAEGNTARVIGSLLIVFGLGLMFPNILKRKSNAKKKEKKD